MLAAYGSSATFQFDLDDAGKQLLVVMTPLLFQESSSNHFQNDLIVLEFEENYGSLISYNYEIALICSHFCLIYFILRSKSDNKKRKSAIRVCCLNTQNYSKLHESFWSGTNPITILCIYIDICTQMNSVNKAFILSCAQQLHKLNCASFQKKQFN